ncbi:MAG: hypothetical protein MK132_05005 [Lentisphaerales bacterium]|nr:hypothetical protein [Lentisphaerales bacterium]
MANTPRKILSGVSWIFIFAVYFSAELILRVYYIHGEGNSKEQMESWANKLPGFLTDSMKSQQRVEEAQKELEEALENDDKKKIIDAYYKLAYEYEGEEQAEIFLKLHEQFPKDIATKNALIFILEESHEKYNFDYLVKYADLFRHGDQMKIYTDAWSKVRGFSLPSQEKYMNILLKKNFVNADLFYVYESFESLAFQIKASLEVEDKIEALKARCLAQLKKRNERENRGGK